MNLSRLETYTKELQSLLSIYDNMENQLISLKDSRAMAQKFETGASTRALEINALITKHQSQMAEVFKMIQDKTRREDMETVQRFIEELGVKAENAAKLRHNLTAEKARHELQAELGELNEQDARKQSEDRITLAQKRYETAIDIVGRLVPSGVVLIGV